MHTWTEQMMHAIDPDADGVEVFARIASAAAALGFEQCAFGLRVPLPVTSPRVLMLNTYSAAWQRRYQEAGYLHLDPTVLHGCASEAPLVWSDRVFEATPQLWDEAQSVGLRHGWCQSYLDNYGVRSMLSLSRSAEALTEAEITHKQMRMYWLVSIAHMALGRLVRPQFYDEPCAELTLRETQVLRWTVDGKTASEIADIMDITTDTVNFHVKNATAKLNSPNKATAAVRALAMGLLA